MRIFLHGPSRALLSSSVARWCLGSAVLTIRQNAWPRVAGPCPGRSAWMTSEHVPRSVSARGPGDLAAAGSPGLETDVGQQTSPPWAGTWQKPAQQGACRLALRPPGHFRAHGANPLHSELPPCRWPKQGMRPRPKSSRGDGPSTCDRAAQGAAAGRGRGPSLLPTTGTVCSLNSAPLGPLAGGIGCACACLWFPLVYDDPEHHPFISARERDYLVHSLAQQVPRRPPPSLGGCLGGRVSPVGTLMSGLLCFFRTVCRIGLFPSRR